jgi:two-component system nitrogen regulation response regulator GlnG/two-component system response regulator HydG
VLLTGETGSGKELAAETIHNLSRYAEGPFTAVNCASYNDDLLGSEMFGSLRGAFTGSTDRPGLFEISNGGTLFLDEIGELSIRGQASLLRVIEEGCVRRMGSHKTRAVDVRIIAATNKNLQKGMKLGTFRKDLFFRLNLLGINVPPLRKRKADIPRLSRNYLKSLFPETPWRLESPAVSLLISHSWPGNVRELQSVLLKASINAERGIIRTRDICLSGTGEDC